MLNKKILAVDDDHDILSVISIILKNNGYTVIRDSVGTYVDTMQPAYPDLIILDIGLNGLDGRDICRKLKSTASTKHIPILFFSAHPELHTICKECEANDYLQKPFEMNELIRKVEKLTTPA